MAQFCFVSIAASAHCDLGGMSYIRTARDLMDRGHEVHWVFSDTGPTSKQKALKLINDNNIKYTILPNLATVFAKSDEEIINNAHTLEEFFDGHNFDCVAIDRQCEIAAFAAHRARLPWAAMGTDGREWQVCEPTLLPSGYLASTPLPECLASLVSGDDFPHPSTNSVWVTSPFLNISFFPRACHEDQIRSEFQPHVHFVGSGPQEDELGGGTTLLVTFGTTFHPVLQLHLAEQLKKLFRSYPIPSLFLTGEKKQAERFRSYYGDFSAVRVEEWMPYRDAYKNAAVVIGHGGPAHVWHGICSGTPLLAVPFVGDQWHGALQLERLNVGRAIAPTAGSRDGGRRSGPLIALDCDEFGKGLVDLLTDPAPLERMCSLGQAMRSGGGVAASASLLEKLASDKEPVSRCIEPACCC